MCHLSANFLSDFWPNFWSNLIADGLIIGVATFLLTRHFSKKDEKQKEIAKESERREKLKIAANMLWAEVEHNRKQLKLIISNLSQRPKPNIVYPALEVSAWEIIDRQLLIDGLKLKDFANLHKIYNRTYTINKMYYTMLDKIEWILLGKDSTVRKEYVDGIIERSKELLEYIGEVFPTEFIKEKMKNKK